MLGIGLLLGLAVLLLLARWAILEYVQHVIGTRFERIAHTTG